jgi:hypothetical protein
MGFSRALLPRSRLQQFQQPIIIPGRESRHRDIDQRAGGFVSSGLEGAQRVVRWCPIAGADAQKKRELAALTVCIGRDITMATMQQQQQQGKNKVR